MDAVGVINAGSSSIKSSLFGVHGDALEMTIHGQAEGPHECAVAFPAAPPLPGIRQHGCHRPVRRGDPRRRADPDRLARRAVGAITVAVRFVPAARLDPVALGENSQVSLERAREHGELDQRDRTGRESCLALVLTVAQNCFGVYEPAGAARPRALGAAERR